MIAKIIPIRSVRKSNFSALVQYLTDPQDKRERVSQVMVTNCYSDDLTAALIEIQNTQEMNKRAKSDKTCHLVLSFPEGERLPQDDLNRIEERFCDVLGFADHQRVSVVHDDTNNLHIHIAINKIHPKKLTIHNPYYDYKKVAQLCEQIEQEYGLTKVNHETVSDKASRKAQDIETKAGVESLIGWIKRECLDDIKRADNWQDLHKVLERNGLDIKERGNGFVFVSSNGVAVKASSIDRSLSKASLTKRFGSYQYNTSTKRAPRHITKQYQPKPAQTKHDTTKLFTRYQSEQHEAAIHRANQWKEMRSRRDRLIERAKNNAKTKRTIIKSIKAGPFGKKMMYGAVYQQLKFAIENIKTDYRNNYAAIKTKHPRMAWLNWLTKEARNGNAEALAVLRSRSTSRFQGNGFSGKNKNPSFISNAEVDTITKNGTVILKAGLTTIRDDGKRLILLSNASQDDYTNILQMAMKKYGNNLAVNGSDQFRAEIVQVAAKHKMPITFDDKALEQCRQQLMKQHRFKKTQSASRGVSL